MVAGRRLGRNDGIRAEIIDGLSDDLVAVAYSSSLEDGEPVEAEAAGESSSSEKSA